MLLDALHAVLVVTLANDCPTKHVDAAMPANRKLGRISKHQRAGIYWYWLVMVGCCRRSGGRGRFAQARRHALSLCRYRDNPFRKQPLPFFLGKHLFCPLTQASRTLSHVPLSHEASCSLRNYWYTNTRTSGTKAQQALVVGCADRPDQDSPDNPGSL